MNILDSKDLAKRLKKLRNKRKVFVDAIESAEEEYDNQVEMDSQEGHEIDLVEREELKTTLKEAKKALEEWVVENKEELDELENLESEISEWNYGATLIDKSDFIEYCEEWCEEIGDLPRYMPSYLVIDWDATADNLKRDYTTVTYQGTDYLVRA